LLNANGIEILYGDTDSLFLKGDNDDTLDITTIAKESFQVDFSKDKVWKLLVLTKSKKQYFGILENSEGMQTLVGLKNNYPAYFNDVVSRLISRETIEIFLDQGGVSTDDKVKRQILDHIRSAFGTLSDRLLVKDIKFIKEKLSYSAKTQKALYEHADSKKNCWQKYIFDEMLEDCDGDRALAEMCSRPKSIHSFWKIVPNGRGSDKRSCTMHPERYTIADHSYKEDLWNCIEPILQAYGFSDNECIKLRNEMVDNQIEL
jgi:hypothetical protein